MKPEQSFREYFKENEDIEYDPTELAKGIKVEMEHTMNKKIAEIIAKHHLAERMDYYTVLAKNKL